MKEDLIAEARERMDKAIAATKEELSSVRTGRASPHLLDRVEVDYYGTKMPLNQIAGISVPEARMLVVTPYDKNALGAIEKAISSADLGLNPNNDGIVIRLVIPPLTEERRRDLVKVVHQRAEDGRVAIRNVRRHVKDEMERRQKEGHLSQDDLHRQEKELQKITDDHVAKVDELMSHKEAELREI